MYSETTATAEGQQIKSIGLGAQKYVLGDEGRFGLKGRCRRCWGGLIGKTDAGHEATAIRCRVCDIILEGIVKLIECRLFSAFLHEAKLLNLRGGAIDNVPRFRSESG